MKHLKRNSFRLLAITILVLIEYIVLIRKFSYRNMEFLLNLSIIPPYPHKSISSMELDICRLISTESFNIIYKIITKVS